MNSRVQIVNRAEHCCPKIEGKGKGIRDFHKGSTLSTTRLALKVYLTECLLDSHPSRQKPKAHRSSFFFLKKIISYFTAAIDNLQTPKMTDLSHGSDHHYHHGHDFEKQVIDRMVKVYRKHLILPALGPTLGPSKVILYRLHHPADVGTTVERYKYEKLLWYDYYVSVVGRFDKLLNMNFIHLFTIVYCTVPRAVPDTAGYSRRFRGRK